MTEGATSTEVYLAAGEPYYDFFHRRVYPAATKGHNVTIDTPLDEIPLLIEGGNILPTRERVRRTSSLMWEDPFTLTVALGKDGSAKGQLYLDDGETYAFEKGEHVHRAFSFTSSAKGGSLHCSAFSKYDSENHYAKKIAHVGVERIIILGANKPSLVTVAGKSVDFDYSAPGKGQDAAPGRIIIKNPGVMVVNDWEIVIA